MEVELISKEYIKTSSCSSTPSHLKTYKISLWDQFVPPIFFSTALFYPITTPQTSLLLKHSLSKTLSHFYPLAGKIKDYVSIGCNDQGPRYTKATCNVPMHEFLTKPDLSLLRKFIPDVSVVNQHPIGASILMIQETTFPCGGLAIGVSVSHLAVDASGLCSFIKSWASATSSPNKQLISPYLDSPLVFPLYESFPKEACLITPSTRFAIKRKVVVKRLLFDASAIDKLKSEAASSVENPSRVEVVSAVITKSVKDALNAKSLAIWHSANLRRKATPPIRDCSMGNFVWIIQAICRQEESQGLSELVLKLRKAKMKLDSEFVKNVKEGRFWKMFEEMKKMESESSDEGLQMIAFSSWCNFGMYNECDFGFGKPIWNTLCPTFGSDQEIMYSNMGILNDTTTGNGVEVWMFLYPQVTSAMDKDVHLLKYASIDPSPLNHVTDIKFNTLQLI